jgi:hypothetical protein
MVSEARVERKHLESKTASSTYLTNRRMLVCFSRELLTLACPRAANPVKIGADVRNPPVGEQSSASVIATGAAKAAASAIPVQIGEEEETRKHQRNGDERYTREREEAPVSAEIG